MNDFKRKLLVPLDFLFNRKIKNYCLGPNAVEVIGKRGVGKSTIYALVCEMAKKRGKKVYSQYPYAGCYQIPVIESEEGKYIVLERRPSGTPVFSDKYGDFLFPKIQEYKKWVSHKIVEVDKDWLYSTDFSDAVILLDEARTIYPARKFASWTIADDEFFNFLRHLNVTVYLSSQEYDALDVNVHRAVDECWFLYKKGNSSFTHVEVYSSMTVPTENLDKEVKFGALSKPMHPLDWDICYTLDRKFKFYRPPYYDLFDTNFVYSQLKEADVNTWDSVLSDLKESS